MREHTHGRHNATMVTVTPRGKCDGHTARKMGRAHALCRKGKAGMRVPYASVHITYLVSSGVLTSVELTLGAMHRVLLTKDRLRDREPEQDVLPDGGTRASHFQCPRSSGPLHECALYAAGLFKGTTGDGCRKCGSR